jgi:pyrophosphatase PpaX
VIFDLDGTLVDTIDLILTSFRHASQEVLGEVLPDEVFLRDVGVPLATQMRSFSEEHAEELLVAYRAHNAAHHDELIREYEGTGPVLDELRRRGKRLAVVTSKLNSVAQRGLDCFGLGDYFDFVIGADDVTAHKPDPHPLLEAAKRLGVAPEVCAYVGDAPFDMMAARGAGMVSIAAMWGAHDPGRVLEPGPDYAIAHIRELPELLFVEESRFRVSNIGRG